MKKLLLAILVLLFTATAFAANQNWLQPFTRTVAITTSDVTEYSPPLTALFVGGTGDVRVVATHDRGTYTCADAPVFTALPVGYLLRVRVFQVCATGTTATLLVGGTFER